MRRTRIRRAKGHANFTSEHHPREYIFFFFLRRKAKRKWKREGAAPLKGGRDSEPSSCRLRLPVVRPRVSVGCWLLAASHQMHQEQDQEKTAKRIIWQLSRGPWGLVMWHCARYILSTYSSRNTSSRHLNKDAAAGGRPSVRMKNHSIASYPSSIIQPRRVGLYRLSLLIAWWTCFPW